MYAQEISSGKYQVLLTSPEMYLEHPTFSKLMRSTEFNKDVACLGIDETHCISQWESSFRKKYGELARLRSFVPLSVPLLIASATMPPLVLTDVTKKLCYSSEGTFLVNLGNNCSNITPVVFPIPGSPRDLRILDFILEPDGSGATYMRTIVFVNSRDHAHQIYEHFQALAPEDKKSQIDFLHSMRSMRAKKDVMRRFRKGQVNILVATEAAGMVRVCLIPCCFDSTFGYREWTLLILFESYNFCFYPLCPCGSNVTDVLDVQANF